MSSVDVVLSQIRKDLSVRGHRFLADRAAAIREFLADVAEEVACCLRGEEVVTGMKTQEWQQMRHDYWQMREDEIYARHALMTLMSVAGAKAVEEALDSKLRYAAFCMRANGVTSFPASFRIYLHLLAAREQMEKEEREFEARMVDRS